MLAPPRRVCLGHGRPPLSTSSGRQPTRTSDTPFGSILAISRRQRIPLPSVSPGATVEDPDAAVGRQAVLGPRQRLDSRRRIVELVQDEREHDDVEAALGLTVDDITLDELHGRRATPGAMKSIVADRWTTATTLTPRAVSSAVTWPVPHPSSSTHEPGRNGNPATNRRRRRRLPVGIQITVFSTS